MTKKPTVLVTGGSIAGPAQAWALHRAGFEVTLLERAPRMREAGQNIDIREAGHDVLRAMGLHERVAAASTGEAGTRYYDHLGQPYAELPVRAGKDGATAELEILRGKLSELILGLTEGRAAHRYGNHVTSLDQDPDGVRVELADGTDERYDLVVVAEGRNSATRRLVFGDDIGLRTRGLYIAYGTIARTEDDDDWWRWLTATDGRMVAVRPDNVGTIRAQLGFLAPDLGLDRLDHATQMRILRTRFAGAGWLTDRILDGFTAAPAEFYLERTDRVMLPAYSRGRVIVVGDAAWAGGPTGMGTTLALVSAYVLAGELHRAGHDHERAFAGYEKVMRPYAEKVQSFGPGYTSALLPRTTRGLRRLRAVHRLFTRPALRDILERNLLSRAGKDFVLPRYPMYDTVQPLAGAELS
ncbi:FAD-dependent monooxygenase [Actinoplanes sp. NPDC051494]|uniref:FAD-dependent monooxygenase n=1 Tax=Actinoplanes sp. NPDC051494 TaxID=3363907 RepID=UPI003793E2BB